MGTTRFVKATGGTAGPFTSKSDPARTMAAALKVAAAGDTIEIMDAATYAGPELILDKPITVTSSYLVAHPGMDPTAAGFDSRVLPTLTPDGASRVMRIQGTPSTRTTLGAIAVSGLRISKGHAIHKPTDPGLGCGGGIVIIDADQVTIDRCVFIGNRTQAAPVTTWPEPDRLALRQAILDLLGDVFTPGTELLINTLIGIVNPLSKTPLPLLSRATVLAHVGADFDAKIGRGRPNHAISGQAFGGGLATVWASPTITRCLFTANTANGRGGGIAVTGYGWPTMAHCVVDRNTTLAGGRCDGGGIGCEVAIPSKLGRDLFENGLVRFLVSKLDAARAALGSPLSGVSVSDLLAYAAWLLQPTHNPLFRGSKALVLDAIHQQWSALTDHALYYFVTTVLKASSSDAWEASEIAAAQTRSITLNESRVSRNHAFDDGGGIYASVLSRVALTSVQISDNRAENMGGGIRLTMGSGGVLAKCSVKGNASGPGGVRGHDRGGGMAARNVDLAMTDCVFGGVSTGRSAIPSSASNVSGDAPGGGLAFEASSEGAMSGIPDLWSSILVEVFGVRSVAVHLGTGCVIGANGAGFGSGKKPMPGAQYAKGGGLFVVRGDFPDAPRLTVTVDAAKTAIKGNRAVTAHYASRAQPNLRVASANEVALQDTVAHKEYTENNWSPLISASGTLTF